MKLQGLIMKGRQCQSLNSDFPVVSSLGSITSSFIMNARPLVTLDQQGGKKMRLWEEKKKNVPSYWSLNQLSESAERRKHSEQLSLPFRDSASAAQNHIFLTNHSQAGAEQRWALLDIRSRCPHPLRSRTALSF
uniref:Uncharacterized protein n=1 Tax=Molossus molossus TaxID=27622 RepID=A0A7J8DT83_MOLMO|nr:hypothetical protein HJG59_009141 [Molossus molossus]